MLTQSKYSQEALYKQVNPVNYLKRVISHKLHTYTHTIPTYLKSKWVN